MVLLKRVMQPLPLSPLRPKLSVCQPCRSFRWAFSGVVRRCQELPKSRCSLLSSWLASSCAAPLSIHCPHFQLQTFQPYDSLSYLSLSRLPSTIPAASTTPSRQVEYLVVLVFSEPTINLPGNFRIVCRLRNNNPLRRGPVYLGQFSTGNTTIPGDYRYSAIVGESKRLRKSAFRFVLCSFVLFRQITFVVIGSPARKAWKSVQTTVSTVAVHLWDRPQILAGRQDYSGCRIDIITNSVLELSSGLLWTLLPFSVRSRAELLLEKFLGSRKGELFSMCIYDFEALLRLGRDLCFGNTTLSAPQLLPLSTLDRNRHNEGMRGTRRSMFTFLEKPLPALPWSIGPRGC